MKEKTTDDIQECRNKVMERWLSAAEEIKAIIAKYDFTPSEAYGLLFTILASIIQGVNSRILTDILEKVFDLEEREHGNKS